jgi:hypothetical protein
MCPITFTNHQMCLRVCVPQDKLGKQAKRVRSTGELIVSKTGICRSEELPQNTIIAPCDSTDPLQHWSLLPENGTIFMAATGECLQLDSGQGGDCNKLGICNGGQRWTKCKSLDHEWVSAYFQFLFLSVQLPRDEQRCECSLRRSCWLLWGARADVDSKCC